MSSELPRLEHALYLALMLLAAISVGCAFVAVAQLDVAWALLLAAVALASFEAALLVTEEHDRAN